MVKKAQTQNSAGETIKACDRDGIITIFVDGAWAGTGKWNGQMIEDCAAHLGADDDETQAIYARLEEGLADAS